MTVDSANLDGLATEYKNPIRLAIIGGTGLDALPHLTPVARLDVQTPWGKPSGPILVMHLHRGPRLEQDRKEDEQNERCQALRDQSFPVAFLCRHGAHHNYAPHEIPSRANLAALRHLGVRAVIALSAVGSLAAEFEPRHFSLCSQIIDRTKGIRPFTFFEDGLVGHVPFGDPFDAKLGALVASCKEALESRGIRLHEEGTLVCIEGPQFSTRAESNLYRSWGATAINMTALPEAKLAREAEMAYAMICMSTDYDCWKSDQISDSGFSEVVVDSVMANMRHNSVNAGFLLEAVIEKISRPEFQDLLQARHLKGLAQNASSITKPAGRDETAMQKFKWLFPEWA